MDYRFRPAPASDMENYEFLADTKGKETTLVPMGPLHITSDEPGHFRLFVEGETIVDADYHDWPAADLITIVLEAGGTLAPAPEL